jgi:hypothetical protein
LDAFGNLSIRYQLAVANWAAYPEVLFAPAPDLPPGGTNTTASRTWVYVYAASGTQLNGMCAIGAAADLQRLGFALPVGQAPPVGVYITLTDRRTGVVYTSNTVAPTPANTPTPTPTATATLPNTSTPTLTATPTPTAAIRRLRRH